MKLLLQRLEQNEDATIGKLNVPMIDTPGGSRVYYTCEDAYREEKLAGKTRIPAGTYSIELRREGGMVKRYDSKYELWHDGMLWLRNVPNFEWVYIHIGNTAADSEGCILVGKMRGDNMSVVSSRIAYMDIYKQVHPFANQGELAIQIVDIGGDKV